MSFQVPKLAKLSSGHYIPTVGLGTWAIPNNIASEVVYNALKVGYRHFDSAVLYDNEKEVSEGILKWIDENPSANKRQEVFYTTKLWNDECGYHNAKRAIKRCYKRVERLGYIDLLLIHSPLCGPKERLETWRAMQEAVDEGIVKSIGISNYGARHIEELLRWDKLKYKPAVNQIEISPWIMRQELADFCRSQDILVEAYAPLNHGGRFKDKTLVKIARKHNVSTTQVLVRWSLQHGNIPLPKTSKIERLESNLDVFGFELSPEEVREIDQPNAYEPSDWECTNAP
ncbi:aldo-keto reductase superfamily protein [Ascoidea rubescens DSM 1968]|uniref:Aldo/keto reductase n=1 Tax=Ascoidea rubescens DSM 1968 TaxID=1344418 RepID=A0A1D2VQ69_9ASCO|nr:Aldo/keto reductase [Ascoidea rubescens DSM 1968]ODV63705.1 Aldo/keto reductase [Ascoidea rubescens DSM 1968]